MEESTDILIVGAGVAGLVAAAILAQAGMRVTVLEARSRVGGRIFTLHPTSSGGEPIELGAEFIHGRPPDLFELLQKAKVAIAETEGVNACIENGELSVCNENEEFNVLEELGDVAATLGDMSFDAFVHMRKSGGEGYEGARAYVEGFNAADASRIGIVALARQQAAEEAIEGGRAWHCSKGYDALPLFLQRRAEDEGARIALEHRVIKLAWRSGKIRAEVHDRQGRSTTWQAKRAIITLPLGVLKARTVFFDPAPDTILTAADAMEAGAAVRLVLQFHTAFWLTKIPRMLFLFSQDSDAGEPLPGTWWTRSPSQAPVLVGWMGGPRALKAMLLSPDDLCARALRSLERIFEIKEGSLNAALEHWYMHDWQEDDLSLGAYSYAPVGAAECSAAMSIPVEETLYFAGEHTDTTGHWGTVHGALRSGTRAARQVLETK